MDADGRNQRKLTSGDYDHVLPSWSRDGRFVYFASNQTAAQEVWKHELATVVFGPLESYDGKTLYYSQFAGVGIWSTPVDGGEEQRLTEAPHLGYWGWFAVTDVGIYLLDTEKAGGSGKEGGAVIQFYDFRNRRLTPVMTLQQDPLPWGANLTASRDGKSLIFAAYKVTSAITMVEYLP
jgi:hypothetical protein